MLASAAILRRVRCASTAIWISRSGIRGSCTSWLSNSPRLNVICRTYGVSHTVVVVRFSVRSSTRDPTEATVYFSGAWKVRRWVASRQLAYTGYHRVGERICTQRSRNRSKSSPW